MASMKVYGNSVWDPTRYLIIYIRGMKGEVIHVCIHLINDSLKILWYEIIKSSFRICCQWFHWRFEPVMSVFFSDFMNSLAHASDNFLSQDIKKIPTISLLKRMKLWRWSEILENGCQNNRLFRQCRQSGKHNAINIYKKYIGNFKSGLVYLNKLKF